MTLPHPKEPESGSGKPVRVLDRRRWEVEVRIDGETVLVIGTDHLSGIPDIGDYGDVVRTCAEHLAAFIGPEGPQPCFLCGGLDDDEQLRCGVCGGVGLLGDPAPTASPAAGIDLERKAIKDDLRAKITEGGR